jgi:hypothetical protein
MSTEPGFSGQDTSGGGDALLGRLSRRQLLTRGAVAALAATLPGVVAAPDAFGRANWLRRASYAGRLGETFRAVLPDGRAVSLRLVAVENLIGTSPSGKSLEGSEDSFLLELDGPEEPRLEQGIHEVRHPAFGRSMLFLVPRAQEKNRRRYAVVVNRCTR